MNKICEKCKFSVKDGEDGYRCVHPKILTDFEVYYRNVRTASAIIKCKGDYYLSKKF